MFSKEKPSLGSWKEDRLEHKAIFIQRILELHPGRQKKTHFHLRTGNAPLAHISPSNTSSSSVAMFDVEDHSVVECRHFLLNLPPRLHPVIFYMLLL